MREKEREFVTVSIDPYTASFEGVAGASASAGSKAPTFTNSEKIACLNLKP